MENSLKGRVYTRWKVLEEPFKKQAGNRNRKYCLCQCSCPAGTIKEVRLDGLLNGSSKSCGCLQKEYANSRKPERVVNLTNQIFGVLKVIKFLGTENKHNQARFLVQCENCGAEKEVFGYSLTSGNTQSCECLTLSLGEEKMKKLLVESGIPFETQKKFSVYPISKFFFDFFVDNKFLIEIDGIQHYTPRSHFFSLEMILHDKQKNQFCLENEIPLYRIPYSHIDSLSLKSDWLEKWRVKNINHYNL